MKVNIEAPKQFAPYAMSLTVETAEEHTALLCLFAYSGFVSEKVFETIPLRYRLCSIMRQIHDILRKHNGRT